MAMTTGRADTTALAADFERHRPYLRAVAYRMLGSLTEADDALQEAWLRVDRRPPADLHDLRPWLTTVVGRICLDALRARKARREDQGGVHLPEPIVVIDGAPEARPEVEAALADSVGIALLVVLDTLSPAERLALVLHDVFGLPFEEVARVVDRSPTAARQLASRARRRIRAARPEPDADVEVQRRVVDAFLAASREGRFEDLLELLDPDAVLRVDFAGRGPYGREPIVGRAAVVAAFRATAGAYAPYGRAATVNGAPGVATVRGGRLVAAVAMSIVDGRIREIDIVADPAKLRAFHAGG
jgi:RNA polymerase sigma factor (sigma-70 family)